MLTAQRNKTLAFFALASLPATAMGFALSVQISVLSWLLATRYGLKIEEIGLVWAAGPLAGILGQVLVGGLSDRTWMWRGRRRVYIIGGGVLAAISMLALPEIGAISKALGLASVLGVAIAVALALDLAVNVGFNPTRALIADVTDEGTERTSTYSIMQVVSGSFGVGAYAIGALFGNMTLIYVAVGLVLLFAVIPSLMIEEPRSFVSDKVEVPATPLWRTLRSLSPLWALLIYDSYALGVRLAGVESQGYLAEMLCAIGTLVLIAEVWLGRQDEDSPFRKTVSASALCWLGIQPIFVFMVSFLQHRMPFLDDEALGQANGLAFLALNAVAALAPLLLGRLAKRYGEIEVHALALALMAAGLAAVWAWAATPFALYALMAVCGIGWGSVVSLPFAIMSERVKPQRMGLFMGLFNLSVVLPQLVTSFGIGTFVARADDKGLIFLLSGGFIVASAFLWWFARPHRAPQLATKGSPHVATV
jgi:maltose/moltooligosaccharide transporter